MSRDDAAALPPEAFPRLPLGLVPASALVELATNADELWDAIEAERAPPAPAAAPRAVLVWRRELTVIHRTLEPDEAGALRRVRGGASFGEVCEALAETGAADVVARALELLLRWLDAEAIGAYTIPP